MPVEKDKARDHEEQEVQLSDDIGSPAKTGTTIYQAGRHFVNLFLMPFVQGMFYGLGEGAARIVLFRYWGIQALGPIQKIKGSTSKTDSVDHDAERKPAAKFDIWKFFPSTSVKREQDAVAEQVA
ncbi:hypothetical protein HDU96_006507 [Phlyctochytrium bullatum]|nr:hypothetical protein HDU96_006507 [Phlyctochytrium bullatum]